MCTQNRGLRRWAEWLNLHKKMVELLENTYTFNPTPPPKKNKSGQHSLISRNVVCLFNWFFFSRKNLICCSFTLPRPSPNPPISILASVETFGKVVFPLLK